MDPGEDISLSCGTAGQGSIDIDGVLFTSNATLPNRGDWEGIQLGGACAARVTDTIVEYAGSNGVAATF